MTLRMKLARWIGGKELASLDAAWQHAYDNWGLCIKDLEKVAARSFKLGKALETIAALETPKANATVRNMARIAREAMK